MDSIMKTIQCALNTYCKERFKFNLDDCCFYTDLEFNDVYYWRFKSPEDKLILVGYFLELNECIHKTYNRSKFELCKFNKSLEGIDW